MDIRRIESGKRDFLPLLLLGDEQEDMIDRYLDRGTLLALYDGGLRAVCVVTKEAPACSRSKIWPWSRPFSARATAGPWVRHVAGACRTAGGTCLLVGTGDSALTLPFYRACGSGKATGSPISSFNFTTPHIRRGQAFVGHWIYFVHGALSQERRRC